MNVKMNRKQKQLLNISYRPYSEQRHDRYESEDVSYRLTVFPMTSAVKS